ncbi:hypothetical protein G7Z17_g2608 [Cylindrodendrum hubeiense]|uniref:Uncharacterized protein n=1 Tax=Cylindrodendrum hubeiense TaxID=595255 RepID=A0A9P5HKI3_9HYPO|nr:hypothetical protein G7Z17_g2608 [Cylindrodendrum hubeiense]
MQKRSEAISVNYSDPCSGSALSTTENPPVWILSQGPSRGLPGLRQGDTQRASAGLANWEPHGGVQAKGLAGQVKSREYGNERQAPSDRLRTGSRLSLAHLATAGPAAPLLKDRRPRGLRATGVFSWLVGRNGRPYSALFWAAGVGPPSSTAQGHAAGTRETPREIPRCWAASLVCGLESPEQAFLRLHTPSGALQPTPTAPETHDETPHGAHVVPVLGAPHESAPGHLPLEAH